MRLSDQRAGWVGQAVRTIWFRRGWVALALGLIAFAVLGRGPLERLQARLPDPLNRNAHITVIAIDPAPPRGTPLVSVKPRLEVIGVIEALSREGVPAEGDVALRVSLFPGTASPLRDDARIVVRESSPDLLEIVSDHLTEERRRALRERVAVWYRAHEHAIDDTLERAKEVVQVELGDDELGQRLMQDEDLRLALGDAVQAEVIDRVDWERVTDRALEGEAGAALGDLLVDAGPLDSAWFAVRDSYKARWKRVFTGSAIPDDGAERTFGDRVSEYNVFVPRWEDTRQAALARAGDNLKEAFPEHEERLLASLKGLAEEVSEEEALPEKGVSAFRRIARDDQLRQTLSERYGEEAWQRVERVSSSLATDPALQRRGRVALEAGLSLLAGVLRELCLDETGEGLNPLLVAFVRARVLRKTEPMLIVDDPGVGEPVTEGATFVSRPYGRPAR
ncbi:MAG: hypothetical protein ACYS22_03445 [Planctomycetota bacterium]